MKRFSLTTRIIVAVALCQLLLVAGLTLMAVEYSRVELRRAFDTALEGRARSTLALVRYTEDKPPALVFNPNLLPPPTDRRHVDLYEIRASDNRLIAQSNGWKGLSSEVIRTRGQYSEFYRGDAPYRAVVLPGVPVLDQEEGQELPQAKVTVVYAAPLIQIHRRLVELGFYVSGMSLLLLLAANGFTAWSIRRGLSPLRDLAAQAASISVHNWNFQPPAEAALASELSPLISAIETVLARLKESFRQQRDFTSDAAHELKTSVAIVKSTLQSLLQRPRTQDEYRAGLEGLLEDSARLEDLLARMLRLARIEQMAESGTPLTSGTTELTSTCEAAISRMRTVADARGISLEFERPAALYTRADPEDLELIWLNLLENAVQYSPAGSKVTMRVEHDEVSNGANMARIAVTDSGPGIPAAELPRIFERFHRGDPSRARATGGFGLGLAICKALVEAYGGTIEAMNLPGCGAEVRVQLPAEIG